MRNKLFHYSSYLQNENIQIYYRFKLNYYNLFLEQPYLHHFGTYIGVATAHNSHVTCSPTGSNTTIFAN